LYCFVGHDLESTSSLGEYRPSPRAWQPYISATPWSGAVT
jgi:hypothetical protein